MTTVSISVDADNSEARAWLPARIQLSRETRPYVFDNSHRLYDWAHKRTTQHRGAVSLTAEELKDGWLFDPQTARTGLRIISVNNERNRCHSEYSIPAATRFEFGYTIYAGNRRRNDGHIECAMDPYILVRRDVWVPMMRPDGMIASQGGMNAFTDPSLGSVSNRKAAF